MFSPADRFPKLAIAVASFAHFVISFWTGTGAGADHPHFRPVLQDARDRVGRTFKVAADAGYDSEAAHVWAREEMGLTSIIPPIHGRPRKDGGPPGGRWRRRMKGILATKGSRRRSGYTQRWQVETTNSMMKRNLSSALAGRTAWSRKRDMTLKVLVHNLMLLRRRGLRQSTSAALFARARPLERAIIGCTTEGTSLSGRVPMLNTQPILSEREWTLVMELLQAERNELPVEMRHTDSRSYSEALDERRSMVEDLVQRLRSQGISPS